MDKKDEIILQQLEVIRTMTERNLRSMGDDFWGTPFEGVLSPKSPSAPPSGGKPVGRADGKMPAQPSDGKTAGGQPAAKAEKAEVVEPLPKEDMKDLQAELDSYIGLATVTPTRTGSPSTGFPAQKRSGCARPIISIPFLPAISCPAP